MKKLLIPFLALSLFIAPGCGKDSTSTNCDPMTRVAPDSEIEAVREYLTSSGITAEQDERGFFYVIQEAGNSDKPRTCSTISVIYKGMLVNGRVFDSSATATSFTLAGTIAGWQEGLPLIGEGGKITLYIPPTLAYGSNPPSRDIPPNAILIFDVELRNVVN